MVLNSCVVNEGSNSGGPLNQTEPNTGRNNIMSTANFYILAKPMQSVQEPQEQHRAKTRQRSFRRPMVVAEPEARLWKVCAELASPRISGFEWVVFLLFGALSLVATASCFSGLFQLLNGDVLEQTVRALLGKG
jgi:hypothetical protein